MPQKLPGDFSKASWKDLRGYCTFCVRHFAFETVGVVHLSGSISPSRLLLGPWAWPFGSVGFPRFQFGPRAWSLCLEGFIFHVVRFPFWTTGVVLCVNLDRFLFCKLQKPNNPLRLLDCVVITRFSFDLQRSHSRESLALSFENPLQIQPLSPQKLPEPSFGRSKLPRQSQKSSEILHELLQTLFCYKCLVALVVALVVLVLLVVLEVLVE